MDVKGENGLKMELIRKMEAAPGFEPGNNGFADRRLSHLATPPVISNSPACHGKSSQPSS